MQETAHLMEGKVSKFGTATPSYQGEAVTRVRGRRPRGVFKNMRALSVDATHTGIRRGPL